MLAGACQFLRFLDFAPVCCPHSVSLDKDSMFCVKFTLVNEDIAKISHLLLINRKHGLFYGQIRVKMARIKLSAIHKWKIYAKCAAWL